LEFSVDEATGQNIIRVLDKKSGEVVRQIPSDEVLAFIKRIKDTKGIIVSRRL
jgi:flagellar protein FlaG